MNRMNSRPQARQYGARPAYRSQQARSAQPRPYQPRPYQPRPYQARPTQPRPAQPRPSQPRPRPAPRENYGKKDFSILLMAGIGVAAIVLAFFLQTLWPNGFPLVTKDTSGDSTIAEIHSGSVRINEIVSANRSTRCAEDGTTPDWIEIINVTDRAQEITGYSLAKSAGASTVFTFPETVLQPGECAVVYADSKLRNVAGEELHAPFNISSDGDTLMLFNTVGSAIDTVNIPALIADQSYARLDRDTWTATTVVTPGAANTNANYSLLHTKAEDSPIRITELSAVNESLYADENGVYSDYIELTNRSSETVDMTGWYLSDDESNAFKWRFPSVTIAPGESIVVFADGKNLTEDTAHLHTSFSLSAESEQAVLSDSDGRLMDSVSYDILKKDQALVLQSDGTWTITYTPTPGSAN